LSCSPFAEADGDLALLLASDLLLLIVVNAGQGIDRRATSWID
jgi:hypothetical protein